MTDRLAGALCGRGGQRRGAVEAREPALGEAAHVADFDQQFGDRPGRQAAELAKRRAALAHALGEVSDDLLLLAIERLDLLVVAVEQLQAQPRRGVVAPAAVATLQGSQSRAHRLRIGQLLAKLQRQLTQQLLGLTDQMLAACEDRAPAVVPQAEQLVALVGPLVLSCAFERAWQQRVREHLARDPLRVKRVGLAALTRAISPRRAVRAHIAHVIAAVDQVHRGVPAPARGSLDPPASDLPELPRPRLQRAMPSPETRKCSAASTPPRGSTTVAVNVRLCGSIPTTLPA